MVGGSAPAEATTATDEAELVVPPRPWTLVEEGATADDELIVLPTGMTAEAREQFSALLAEAQTRRNAMTPAETRLLQTLGEPWRSQHVLDDGIADFYRHGPSVAVMLDGHSLKPSTVMRHDVLQLHVTREMVAYRLGDVLALVRAAVANPVAAKVWIDYATARVDAAGEAACPLGHLPF